MFLLVSVILLTPQEDGYCCGQYASYWNAFLFLKKCLEDISPFCVGPLMPLFWWRLPWVLKPVWNPSIYNAHLHGLSPRCDRFLRVTSDVPLGGQHGSRAPLPTYFFNPLHYFKLTQVWFCLRRVRCVRGFLRQKKSRGRHEVGRSAPRIRWVTSYIVSSGLPQPASPCPRMTSVLCGPLGPVVVMAYSLIQILIPDLL